MLAADALQVDGGALAGERALGVLSVNLNVAYACAHACGQDFDVVADLQLAGDQRAGDDRAEAFDREGVINRQARHGGGVLRLYVSGEFDERLLEFFDACACARADGDDRRVFEKRSSDEILDFGARQFQQFFINQIGFRQRHQSRFDAQQTADVEVFARLRHDGFIRRDDEHHEIKPMRAGQHILDEALVPRHVDKAEAIIANGEVGKAYVNGDAARFFFFEAVGVNACEGFDQRRLPVIDVPGGADDDVLHGFALIINIQERLQRRQTSGQR